MAKSYPGGFKCEFIDTVPDDFYCKECHLVAKDFTITSCCGETYCHSCIAEIKDQGKMCPICEEKDFSLTHQVKYQRRVKMLKVFCTKKESGCEWLGTLEQLETHIALDQNNCQYVDIKCPLNCQENIPKYKLEQHVSQLCTKRNFACQHCNFKASYAEVMEIHLPKCKYVPLQCPNRCGVTFERDFMEDHMNMCRLEEVSCEFAEMGCDDLYKREDKEEHARQNTLKHLTLTASLVFQQKMKYTEMEQALKQRIEDLEHKLRIRDKNISEINEKLKEQNKELEKQRIEQTKLNEMYIEMKEKDKKLKEIDDRLKEKDLKMKKMDVYVRDLNKHSQTAIQELERKLTKMLKISSNETDAKLSLLLTRTFKMENFYAEKQKGGVWCGPFMYSHIGGYKFQIRVRADGFVYGRGKAIQLLAVCLPGEFDDKLKWPVRMKLTIELVHQYGSSNLTAEDSGSWKRPKEPLYVMGFSRIKYGEYHHFINHSELDSFLMNDALTFHISQVEIC